ncbi:MAG: hypothetical protein E7508_06085 [Ruminococcus sp.]|nr:hypothetical protein [Ruminococcus sp.]
MLKFILGGAGYGKSTMLIDTINKLSDTDKKIIFIVPEQFSFESDKKIYKKLGAEKFNKVLSLSFTSLAKEIFEKYGGRSGEYAEDIHKFILMNKTVRELVNIKAFQYYEKQANKPGFVNDALSIINEFRQCGISPDELLNVCNSNHDCSEKMSDLSMIYTTYDRMMTDADLKDSLTDISEAAAVANMNDYFKDSIIIIDEFESFTGDQYELIDTMFAQAEDIYIALRLENVGENSFGVFESVEKTWKSFYQLAVSHNMEIVTRTLEQPLKYESSDLAFLNKNVLRSNKVTPEKAENISITCCRDLYEEADFVCAQIRELVTKYGYRYRDIAVISRQLDEYVYIFEAAFEKYDIPYFMDVEKSTFHTRIMQYMINTVNIICEDSPSLEAVLTYMKTSLSGLSIEKTALLENYCYEWGLEGKDFFKPFTAGTDENPEPEQLRQIIINPVAELRKKCRNADCSTICYNLYDFLFQSKIPLRLSELNEEFIKSGMVNQAKEQKRIWDILMKILETFSDIGNGISLKEFGQLFISSVQNIKFSVPPQTLDSVHIARAETARLASPKAVFIVGVNEGFFPSASYKTGLLNEKDRAGFEKAGMHLSRSSSELASDEKLIVYKSLTHASEKLYILYPLCDNSGSDRFPAAVISQIKRMFENDISSKASDKGLLFYSSTPQAAYSNFVRNFGKDKLNIKEIKKVLMEDEGYSARIEYLYKVSERKDFHIEDKELIKRIYSDRLTVSPTAFEDFQMCRFRFFCKTALGLKALRRREIQSLEQGNIVHMCLERIISSCSTKEEFDALDENKILSMTDSCINEYMLENMGGDTKRTQRLTVTVDNIKQNILKIVLHIQQELSQSEFRPVEYEFSIENGNVPVIKTDNGIEIILRGVIDRVDMYEENGQKYIRVIDYKTGKKKFSVASLLYGINMQMLLYMFSITGKNGKYSDSTPAGVLYMPSREITCDRDRDDTQSIDDYLNKHYKMNGVVLRERNVLTAMEKDIGGIYIPAKLVKADTGSGELMLSKRESLCFSSREFINLKKHTDKLLMQLADELYDGRIDADPLIMGSLNPCEFCDYWSVCGNVPCYKFHEASENAHDEMLEIISVDETK